MKPKILIISTLIAASCLIACSSDSQKAETVSWKHLSTVKGDLPVPNSGDQQTLSLVLNVDKDGINGICLILGAADTGKTTLAAALAGKFLGGTAILAVFFTPKDALWRGFEPALY